MLSIKKNDGTTMTYSSIFFDRENMHFFKSYQHYFNVYSSYISKKLNNDNLAIGINVIFIIINIIIIGQLLIFTDKAVQIGNLNVSGLLFGLTFFYGIYKEYKFKEKSELQLSTLVDAYSKEIEIYLFILVDLEHEYSGIINEKSFRFKDFNFSLKLSKTEKFLDYIKLLIDKFSIQDSFETFDRLKRIHKNTKHDLYNSDSFRINPFFEQFDRHRFQLRH